MATTARLNFLDEAADLLAFSSPTTAAQLHSTRLEPTQEDVVKAQVVKNDRLCGGCGDSLIPWWNCSIRTKKRTRQERLNQDKSTKFTTVQCARCNSFTMVRQVRRSTGRPVPQQPMVQPATERKKVVAVQKDDQPTQGSITPSSTPTESAVKKRSRNKKSSLQSLLADRKAVEPKKGSGLGLMDFMKTWNSVPIV
ncbi:hypothetical protein CLAFUW4_12358 [Fulvia fulva]|uniref:Uncharacterized protein n=1 Tax=Passalora fulva TaxID=5499 RepID=A0A9Q8USN4_PASFU|nr:uncharacterized protein CLAFUR5_11387 [Fulvia fulva]KAK4618133.1 hypothetical protein CLAFUR4_12363 [Fulvia fulva]KAK4618804.1 hypothetical protein CLAFUR0_12374 [Fulvia fulva]UJO20950.1 hypothetical protein CLAFUR5_11387 [Fulvia fulva]WPV18013.1 hypothetical protein CLAFUW4_12358 [Fulvia fulva]WPV33588.1 hypothetical protein CLAFUW7_12365 [Fulvia fulva]